MNNSFNHSSLGQTFGLAANCLSQYQTAVGGGSGNGTGAAGTGSHHLGGSGGGQLLYHQAPQQTTTQQQQQSAANQQQSSANTMRMAIQQFATGQFVSFAAQPPLPTASPVTTGSANSASSASSGTTTTYLKNVSCLQKEIESLKKQNLELQSEVEKLRAAYTECNYQVMADGVKLTNYYEQVQRLEKDKLDSEKAYKELKMKYDEKFAMFGRPGSANSDERSLFCDECNFEVKSQVALFIHKLNHYFEQSIPRHLQLSTRSFSTMPDDSTHFKYKCHCCEIDPSRQYGKHEIYMHIYQFHTFDMPYKCKFCFLYFTSKSYLNDHLVEKHSVPSTAQHHQSHHHHQRQRNARGRGRAAANNHHQQTTTTNQSALINDPNFLMSATGQQYLNLDTNSQASTTTSDQQQNQYQIQPNINSTLSLSARTQPLPQQAFGAHVAGHYHNKRQRTSTLDYNNSQPDINELFQQLVGETLDVNNADPSGQQHHHHHLSANNNQSSSQLLAQNSTTSKTFESMKRDAEIQQIMNDLDTDDSLNCKYPGCKFVATTKNHLKFHISAHLMSKYKCPYCTFVGNRIVEIKRHILKSSKHTDQHVFLCPGCDFASDCEKTFRDHYTRYHNSQADVTLVIERMFLNESNKVGQNIISAFSSGAHNNNNNSTNNNSSTQQSSSNNSGSAPNTTNANNSTAASSSTNPSNTSTSASETSSVTTTITKSTS